MKTRAQAIKDGDIKENKPKVVLFQKTHPPKEQKVMRPGKTNKDKNITKCWGNRFENQQRRANQGKEKR